MTIVMTQRELFGGAIVANLPKDFIDASDLREIPDHQEVFLSPTTLTSIIIEINVYQTKKAVDLHYNQQQSSSSPSPPAILLTPQQITQQTPNQAASTFHFTDPILPPDTLSPTTFSLFPPELHLPNPTVTQFPAYIQTGTILSPEIDRSTQSILPPDWQNNPAMISYETKVWQLLIRMEEFGTDFCVRVNVPLKEFGDGSGDAGAEEEVRKAEEIMEAVMGSLEVREFEVFGGVEGDSGDDEDDEDE